MGNGRTDGVQQVSFLVLSLPGVPLSLPHINCPLKYKASQTVVDIIQVRGYAPRYPFLYRSELLAW